MEASSILALADWIAVQITNLAVGESAVFLQRGYEPGREI